MLSILNANKLDHTRTYWKLSANNGQEITTFLHTSNFLGKM